MAVPWRTDPKSDAEESALILTNLRQIVCAVRHVCGSTYRNRFISRGSLSRAALSIPLDRAAQSLSEIDDWLIAKQFLSQLNSGQRVANVSRTCR